MALWVAVIAAVVLAAILGGQAYVRHQWYVGESDGRVAIYHGIPGTLLGYRLSHVAVTTDIPAAATERLQVWKGLADGIPTNSLADAQDLVAQIRQDVSPVPGPRASPSAGPTPSPTGSA